MANMFDLEKRKKNTVTKKEITPEEKAKLLENCTEIPYEQWVGIKKKSFVRYERKDGVFRKGGFVHSIWKSTSVGKNGNLYMKLYTKGYGRPWILNLKEIKKIWTCPINTKNKTDNTTELKAEIEELKKELESVKKEQRNIIAVIKRLHSL